MAKKKIKKLVLMLALTNALSIATAKADNQNHFYYILDKSGKLKVVDDINVVIHDGKTLVSEDDDIMVYNQNNTFSRQYGGSQNVFIDDFDYLINNPYIWEEMQTYFPVSEFPSKEYAMDFYRFYFDDICRHGCGYVSMASRVFQEFEGREDEFLEVFGYPMYTIGKDGSIDFNYEIFTLKFFNYNALYPDYNEKAKEIIKNMHAKTLAKLELDRFMQSDKYIFEKKDWHELEEKELFEYIDKVQYRDNKYEELIDRWKSARDYNYPLEISLDNSLGHIRDYLESFDLSVDIQVQTTNVSEYNPGDIVVFDKFRLFKVDSNGRIYSDKNIKYPHSVNIVSNENGKVVVSTWGQCFVLDDHDASWTIKIVLNIKSNSKKK